MTHYLITRFNLKNPDWVNENNEYYVLTQEWLDERFTIFETYCLPSVKNQSNQNFVWLVFFYVDTPKHFLGKIHQIAENFENFKPIFIDGFKELGNELKLQIEHNQLNIDDYFITTRLDNDDIIHKDFIKTIQDLYIPRSKSIIDLRLGYQVILLKKNKTEIRNFKVSYNPFLSVITKLSDFDNLMTQKHDYWKVIPHKIIHDTQHMWIQVIHQNNKLNQKQKALKKVAKINSSDFGVHISNPKESPLSIWIYNVLMFPYRTFFILKKSLKKIKSSN